MDLERSIVLNILLVTKNNNNENLVCKTEILV